MKYIFDMIYAIALVIYLPKVLYRRFFQDRYTSGGSERAGFAPEQNPCKKCIWIHAVSVGEVNATKTLVDKLQKELADVELVMSTTTDTGYARAKTIYGDKMAIFYYPLDFSWAVRRAFKRVKPNLCLLVELEVWPNFAREARQRRIPLLVFNGRLSDKSFPRYKLIKPIAKRMFADVCKFLVQTEEYKQRFMALGVEQERIVVTGSVKYDTASMSDKIEGSGELAAKLNILPPQRLFVAGGTGPGEEAIILDVFKNLKERFGDLRLVLVPRKPERFNEVAALIESRGFAMVRYSEVRQKPENGEVSEETVILGDTMGDLRKFYSLSEVVFVGRSLCAFGGSDMMEPTAMGKFTTFGQHTFNFKHTVEQLLAGSGAVEVSNSAELEGELTKALCDGEYKNQIAQNGKRVIAQNQGATEKSAEIIKQYLNYC